MDRQREEETVAIQQLPCLRLTATQTARLWCTVSWFPLSAYSRLLNTLLSFLLLSHFQLLPYVSVFHPAFLFNPTAFLTPPPPPPLLFEVLSCFCLELLSFFCVPHPPPLVLFLLVTLLDSFIWCRVPSFAKVRGNNVVKNSASSTCLPLFPRLSLSFCKSCSVTASGDKPGFESALYAGKLL